MLNKEFCVRQFRAGGGGGGGVEFEIDNNTLSLPG